MADDTDAGPRASPPGLLNTIKDDLGIPPADTSQDAWLQRRIDGVWARMEAYCFRKLPSPPAVFIDDWGQAIDQHYSMNLPPVIAYCRRGSIFLRYFPVTSIDALVMNGTSTSAANATYDATTGKLLSVDGSGIAVDLGATLLWNRAKITYKAGWASVPPDLYECLLGALQVLYNDRQAQGSGLGGGAISQVTVQDVGDVRLEPANPFVTWAGSKAPPGGWDPLLGPWAATLDAYVDHRSAMGVDYFQTTVPGP